MLHVSPHGRVIKHLALIHTRLMTAIYRECYVFSPGMSWRTTTRRSRSRREYHCDGTSHQVTRSDTPYTAHNVTEQGPLPTSWHFALRWRHNGRDSVSNHQHHECLLNRLFRRRSKETSKRRVTGLCAGNSPGTGEFPAQMASNAENVSIWWRHHGQGQWKFFPSDFGANWLT